MTRLVRRPMSLRELLEYVAEEAATGGGLFVGEPDRLAPRVRFAQRRGWITTATDGDLVWARPTTTGIAYLDRMRAEDRSL